MSILKEFIEIHDDIIENYRKEKLIELGLVERIYSPDNNYSEEYPNREVKGDKELYYREEPITVTDEEWELIQKKVNEVSKIIDKKDNKKVNYFKEKFDAQAIEKKGKSSIAEILFNVSKIVSIILIIIGVLLSAQMGSGFVLIATCLIAFFLMLSVYISMAILNYLAEICYILKKKM